MHRGILVAISVLALLPLSVTPSASQCCQYKNGCSEAAPRECRGFFNGVPAAGTCDRFTGQCRVAAPPPPPGKKVCCQFHNGGCSETVDKEGCKSVGGTPAVGYTCRPEGGCRR
jgi:hypothetical protein